MLFRKLATLQPIVLIQISLAQDSSAAGAGGHDTTVDYPTYNEVPVGLSFSCSDRLPGYYADPAAQCQVSCLLHQYESRQVSQLFIFNSLNIKRFFLVQTTQAGPGVKLPLLNDYSGSFPGWRDFDYVPRSTVELKMSKIFSTLPTCLHGLDSYNFTSIAGC